MLGWFTNEELEFCDGVSRRRALQVGALGPLGLALPQLLSGSAEAAEAGSGFGRAKRVILLFMWGGPAHQDTWDLKPDGPLETRGEFQPIATNVPGMHISEHFPLIARQADKLALIRSVAQEDNRHSTGAHAGLTGRKHELQRENFAARDSDFPHYGSVLSKLNPSREGLPSFVALPDIIATTAGVVTPGQTAGFLGRRYDPFQIVDHPDEDGFSIDSLTLPESISRGRMRLRRDLLEQFDAARRLADTSSSVRSLGDLYDRALSMILSPAARKAFDIQSVPDEERWRYGWHTFGQSVLMARRLIESGVKLVTVYWHREVKTIDSSWDTHSLNFQELKNRLMPAVDRPIAALLADLEARGLLDETLVVWNSEFGRTPKINKNAGRDHWGPCNTVVMAGGGVPGGQVFGATDEQAAYPVSEKVTQDDVAATIYHLLGYDGHTTLVHDRTGRPYPIALGEPIHKLLGASSKPEPQVPPVSVKRDEIGPFHRMLKERARRYLVCDFGFAGSEKDWELSGFSDVKGQGSRLYRTCDGSKATLLYGGHFYPHFDYSHLVIRLDEPRRIEGLELSVGGRTVPVPEETADAGAAQTWQIPFPDGLIAGMKEFELKASLPADWKVSAIALVGDPIHERHLARLG